MTTAPARPRYAERAAAIFASRPKRLNQPPEPKLETASARYLTRSGEALRKPDLATEIVSTSTTSHRVRCHCGFKYFHSSLEPAKETAQSHADRCSWLPAA